MENVGPMRMNPKTARLTMKKKNPVPKGKRSPRGVGEKFLKIMKWSGKTKKKKAGSTWQRQTLRWVRPDTRKSKIANTMKVKGKIFWGESAIRDCTSWAKEKKD